jgi:hypothetical protein
MRSMYLAGAAIAMAVAGTAVVPAGAQAQPNGRSGGAAALFNQIDANQDGRVHWDEVWSFVQRRFAEADRDRSGSLSEEEMAAAMQARWAERRRAPPEGGTGGAPGPRGGEQPDFARLAGNMFRALDANGDRRVTLDEIQPAVQARFRWLDANMDNVVDRSELPQPRARRSGGGRPDGAPQNPG